MIITIQATGIDLTDSIKEYATEKITSLGKFFDGIVAADIDIGMRGHHHQKGDVFYAEVNMSIPGHLLRVVKESNDLYKAIDKVRDHYKVEFEKIKGKMRGKDRDLIRDQRGYVEE